MFRRGETTIEPDAYYEADLEALGFFINDADQIRMIGAPEKPFEFTATNNDRHNEVRNEALHVCIREEVNKRLANLGIDRCYLPGFTDTKPNGPHVPILAPKPEIMKTKDRLIIVVNDSTQDLGILSYSRLQRDLGVNGGSIVDLAIGMTKQNMSIDSDEEPELDKGPSKVRNTPARVPGLVVMNTGQLFYSHDQGRAMSLHSWLALPRKSITHEAPKIIERKNLVRGHRTPAEHIKTVFDEVLWKEEYVKKSAEIYFIAIGDGVENLVKVLEGDFEKYGTRIAGMAIVQSPVDDSQIKHPCLRALLHQRSCQWKYSDISSNPMHCIELPPDYCSGALCDNDVKRPENQPEEDLNTRIRWNTRRLSNVSLSDVTNTIRRFALRIVPYKKDSLTPEDLLANPFAGFEDPVPICPTFAGGSRFGYEDVITDSSVQRAIMSFIGQISSDPDEYYNTGFKIYTQAPQPTPHAPLALDPEAAQSAADVVEEISPENIGLIAARERLSTLRASLEACPTGVEKLRTGRDRLEKKVVNKESEIARLEEKALGSGELKAGEAKVKRENWNPKIEGPKVPFAGEMIDSELLKAAGLTDTAEEELKKLDVEGEGKAKEQDR